MKTGAMAGEIDNRLSEQSAENDDGFAGMENKRESC